MNEMIWIRFSALVLIAILPFWVGFFWGLVCKETLHFNWWGWYKKVKNYWLVEWRAAKKRQSIGYKRQ